MLNDHAQRRREWLSLTRADGPVYLASLALLAMINVHDTTIEVVLAVVAVVLALVACWISMPRDPEVSAITNLDKRIWPPLFVVFVLALICFWFDK